MKNLTPEQMLSLATAFSLEISKNCSKNELITYRTFFQEVANNLQFIIAERSNK